MFVKFIQFTRYLLITALFTSSLCHAGGGGHETYKQLDQLRKFAKNGLTQTRETYASLQRFWILAEENSRNLDASIQFIGLVEKAQLLLLSERIKSSPHSHLISEYYTVENIMATFEALMEVCDGKSRLPDRQVRQACIWAGKLITKTDQYCSHIHGNGALSFNLPDRNTVLQRAWEALESAKLMAYQGKHAGIPLLYQCDLLLLNHFLPRVDQKQITEETRIQLAEEFLETFKRNFEYSGSSSGPSDHEIFGLQKAIQHQRGAEERALSLSTHAPKVSESEERRELERLRRALAKQKSKLPPPAVAMASSLSGSDSAEEASFPFQPASASASAPAESHDSQDLLHQIINATTQTEQSVYLRSLSPLHNNCFFEGIQISRQTAMDQLLAHAHSLKIRRWIASEVAEAFVHRVAAPEEERERLLLENDLQNELDQFAIEYTLHPTHENYQALLERCTDIHVFRSYILNFRQSHRMISIRRNEFDGDRGMLDAIGFLFQIDIQVFEHPEDAQGERLELIHHYHPVNDDQPAIRQALLSLSTLASHFSLLEPAPQAELAQAEIESRGAEEQPSQDLVDEGSPESLQPRLLAPQKRSASAHSDSEETEHPAPKKRPIPTTLCTTFGKQIQSTYLKAHLETHESERKQFPCVQCGKSFLSMQSLNIHDQTVHQEIQYPCAHCEKTYQHESSLRSHMKAMHSDNSDAFTCKICGHHFSRGSNLRRHMKTVHKDREPDSKSMETQK